MIFEFLNENEISYQRVDHPAVFTCEEAKRLVPHLAAADTKNLFLRDNKGKRHFLVAVPPEKNVDLKALSKVLCVSGLSLASSDRLSEYLNLTPGSVTLLAVINDPSNNVAVIIDEDLWSNDAFQCHPLVNTSTLVLNKSELSRFFALTQHIPKIIIVPAREAI